MSGLWKEMRPYLALWRPVARLAVGSWRLLGKVTSRCMAGEGSDKAWRALGLLVGVELLRRFAERAPLLMLPVTLAWLVLAWRHGPAPKAKAVPAENDADGQGQQEQPEPEQPPLPDREQLVEALHAVANPHAQTVPLADHLSTSHTRVREALKQAGIPLSDGVRMKGRSSAAGVRREDFPPLPSPTTDPDRGVVAAGQRPATTTTTPEQGPIVERPHPGMLIIRDRADQAARHHTVPRT